MPYTAVSMGLTATLIAGSVSIGGGYIGASAANKNMDPTKWDWTSPKTYGGFFEGFTTTFMIGSGFAGQSLTREFVKHAILPAAAGAYIKGSWANQSNYLFWEWRWDSEGMAVTFGEMLEGFGTVFMFTSTPAHVKNFNFDEFMKNPISGVKQLLVAGTKEKISNLLTKLPKGVAKNIAGLLSALAAAAQVAEFVDIDLDNIKFNELSTYENLFNGFAKGKEAFSQEADLQKSIADVSKQERVKSSSSRKKRSLEWKITLMIDPSLFHHNFEPKVIAQAQPALEMYQGDAVDDQPLYDSDHGYIVPSVAIDNQHFVDKISSEGKNFNSSFDVLQMGDSWLQQADTVGNLTLLNLLAEKFFGSKKSHQQEDKKFSKTNVEYQLIASEIVNESVEKFLKHAEDCGIPDYVMNKLFEDSIDLSSLNKRIEKEIRRKEFSKVAKIIVDDAISKLLQSLKKFATEDQIEKLRSLSFSEACGIEAKLVNFEENSK